MVGGGDGGGDDDDDSGGGGGGGDDGNVETNVTGDDAAADDDCGDKSASPSPTHVAQSEHLAHTRMRCSSFRHFSIVTSRDMMACILMSADS